MVFKIISVNHPPERPPSIQWIRARNLDEIRAHSFEFLSYRSVAAAIAEYKEETDLELEILSFLIQLDPTGAINCSPGRCVYTPMELAIEFGRRRTIRLLWKFPSYHSIYDVSLALVHPFTYSLRVNRIDLLPMLLKLSGHDPRQLFNGTHLLYSATIAENLEGVKFGLRLGLDVDFPNALGLSALNGYLYYYPDRVFPDHKFKCLNLLKAVGASIDIPDDRLDPDWLEHSREFLLQPMDPIWIQQIRFEVYFEPSLLSRLLMELRIRSN